MTIALDAPLELDERVAVRADSFRWHAYTVVFAAACVMTGVYWDISWHMSIGRDTFWTPAHLLIQAGGLTAGLSSGYVALMTTFRGSDETGKEFVVNGGLVGTFSDFINCNTNGSGTGM